MHFALRGTSAAGRKAAHARSASHPCHCQCHPVHTRLDAGVRALRAWSASAADGSSGLGQVEAVLAVLGEFLALPQAAAALRDDVAACDRFLTLADAYGSFEQALVALKQSVAQLRAGVRLGDGTMVAAAMRHASRHAMLAPADVVDGEVTGVVAEAAAATASASEAIFLWCAAMSPDVSAVVETVPVNAWLARLRVVHVAKKAVSLPETAAALERLEERIGEVESGSEKVFSSLLQTRVSLLNIHNTTTL